MRRDYRIGLSFMGPVTLAASGLAILSAKLYDYAFRRIDYVPDASADEQQYAEKYFEYVKWYQEVPSSTWSLNQGDPENYIVAKYIPADRPSKKSVIIAHGYKGNGETMANFAKMFHDWGYHVLVPDDRGHGASSGKYINFGWIDRLDYVQWSQLMVRKLGKDINIALFGVSMGGATVQMASGEHLPPQVKVLVSDCGYSSLEEELVFLLKQQFHLPKQPITGIVSRLNQKRLGFPISVVSSTEQLKKNKLPILFIHGQLDRFVPSWMTEKSYSVVTAPKAKWIVKNATHAESYWIDPLRYHYHVKHFIEKFI
ncbi:alpha/beta hydrolase [Pediococcus stilesii]|uniref:Alpha/beta hydrolase n=1 Tax=Pediococcus stilesii TaxID=331679 RepID=A0A5R9BYF1_9LACO|nr:alpha/beta hydrolase [Pediococcus stilesii]TLQ05719.1 alpha/beta hydrolase [Pediococcus stilesii]